MRGTLLLSLASVASVCLVSSGYGCGSSNSSPPPTNDGGNETSSGSSGGSSGGSSSGGSSGSSSGGLPQPDASADTGGGMPCTAMPQGKQIVALATANVLGVTSDGQLLYSDSSSATLSVVPIAGGTPTMLGAYNGAQSVLFTAGTVAAFFTNLTQNSAPLFGPLTVWTAAGGAKNVSTSSYYGSLGSAFDISSDGKYVLYTDNATATMADIYVADTDGTNKVKLAGGVSWGSLCTPILAFAGDDVVMSYCTAQPDAATSPVATVIAWSGPPTWQTSQTFANGDGTNFVAGHAAAGGSVVAFSTSAGLQVETLGGTTPTVIDANGTTNAFINHGGTGIIYFDRSANIWTSALANPAPAELVAGPVIGTLALSSDDKWLEFAKAQDPNTGYTDMYLASTTPVDGGATVTTLTSMPNGSNFGDAFTADNSQALFFTPVDMNGVAPFLHLRLPPSGAASPISMSGWEGFATTGTKVVYGDNSATSSGHRTVDLEGVDVATTAGPTKLVTGADANFLVTTDKKTVVYSWNFCSGVTGGIYMIAAP